MTTTQGANGGPPQEEQLREESARYCPTTTCAGHLEPAHPICLRDLLLGPELQREPWDALRNYLIAYHRQHWLDHHGLTIARGLLSAVGGLDMIIFALRQRAPLRYDSELAPLPELSDVVYSMHLPFLQELDARLLTLLVRVDSDLSDNFHEDAYHGFVDGARDAYDYQRPVYSNLPYELVCLRIGPLAAHVNFERRAARASRRNTGVLLDLAQMSPTWDAIVQKTILRVVETFAEKQGYTPLEAHNDEVELEKQDGGNGPAYEDEFGELASEIAARLGVPLTPAKIARFPDGEVSIQILENVRNSDVYIIQPTCPPVNDNLMELLL